MHPFSRACGAGMLAIGILGVALFTTVAGAAAGAVAGPESRYPTAAERATFLPLICQRPRRGASGDTQCAKLFHYSDSQSTAFAVTAILYGSFTAKAADEAYLTYYSSAESHAHNFGGGVLFARTNGHWKLARWYPGGEMDRCVLIPHTSPQRVLCTMGFTNQGETTSSVWAFRVPGAGNALATDSAALVRADDTRDTSTEAENGCYSGVPKGQARLLLVDAVKASSGGPSFATAKVTYETGDDIAAACSGGLPRKVPETTGEIQFRESGGTVSAVMPAHFVKLPDAP